MEENKKSPSTTEKAAVEKTADELLKQYYLTAKDLTIIMPGLKIEKARKHVSEIQSEMIEKGYYIPVARPKLVLTKLVKKKFGL